MIRYIDEESLEKDYITACNYDKIYGTMNASLYRLYSKNNLGMFWNLYNETNALCGNLSFVNNTFTLCLNDESCITEVAKFIDFWGNFNFIKCNYCNATKLYNLIEKSCKLAYGDILTYKRDDICHFQSNIFCKDIDTYSTFEILSGCFPQEMSFVDFQTFNYEMNYRIRKGESFLFGLKKADSVVSVAEILCINDETVIIGFLATRKESRKQGFASSLLRCILSEFSNKNVFILADNEKLSAFYKKIGFDNFTAWAQLEAV